MRITKTPPNPPLPALTLELDGGETTLFMEFLFRKEAGEGVFQDRDSLYGRLYRAGFRRPADLT